MRLSINTLLWAAALILAGTRTGQAEDVRLTTLFDPFGQEAPASTYNPPEISLVGYNEADCGESGVGNCNGNSTSCCPKQPHVGQDFFVCKDRGCGWFAGVEFMALRPYAGAGFMDTGAGGPQLNFEPAYRLTAGRQMSDGLGARMRYFEFNRGDTTPAGTLGVQARYLDAELTQTVDFRSWNLLFSGGLRYAQYQANNSLFLGNVGTGVTSDFNGFGSTFGGQASRNLNQSGSLRLVTAARWSTVFGNNSVVDGGVPSSVRDNLINIMEINIGTQYRRQLRNGSTLVLGGGLEAQNWVGVLANGGGDDMYNAGFAGFTSSFGIMR